MDYTSATGSNAAANRAERFEDEKRRIIDSCFNKKDTDGLRKTQLPSFFPVFFPKERYLL